MTTLRLSLRGRLYERRALSMRGEPSRLLTVGRAAGSARGGTAVKAQQTAGRNETCR
jgi:hypothetical protein